jgi:hypothetical protein
MKRLLFAAVVMLGVIPAFSQPKIASQAAPILFAAPPENPVSGGGLQFSASSDGSNATVKWGYEPESTGPTGVDAAKPGLTIPFGAKFTTFTVTGQAPVSKSTKSSTLISLDGFGDATSLGLTFSQFATDWYNLSDQDEASRRSLCDDLAKKTKDVKDVYCGAKYFDKYLPEKAADYRKLPVYGPQPGGFLYGASGKLSQQNLTFYDPNTLAKQSDHDHPWSVGAFAGWIPKNYDRGLLMLTVGRQRTFQNNDEAVRCPAGGTGTIQCTSGSFGSPKSAIGTVLKLEARSFLGEKLDKAISLAVSRDWGRQVTSVELPFFFIGTPETGITGGAKLNWNSGDRKTALSLFIGVPFGLYTPASK